MSSQAPCKRVRRYDGLHDLHFSHLRGAVLRVERGDDGDETLRFFVGDTERPGRNTASQVENSVDSVKA